MKNEGYAIHLRKTRLEAKLEPLRAYSRIDTLIDKINNLYEGIFYGEHKWQF